MACRFGPARAGTPRPRSRLVLIETPDAQRGYRNRVPSAFDPNVTLDAIREARSVIGPYVRSTPVWPSLTLSALTGAWVSLKCEQLQTTGSFKLRGATNYVRHLDAEQRARGLVATSAGFSPEGED